MPKTRMLIVSAVALTMIVVSCSSSTSTPPGTIRQGGDITLGAGREPECMDWIGACAGSDWGTYTVEANTMPRAYDYTPDGYKPSILLTGEATVTTTPKQVVTYHINPKAVWSDGDHITSRDFEYTWDQIAHGLNIYSQVGYNLIQSVDDSDPRTAVVTFASPYLDWKILFGGPYGILPRHLLEGRDRDSVMHDGYSFSGGPWKLDHWTRGTEVKLVPNTAYWGKKPNLGSVTFTFITDPTEERDSYRSGQVLAVYPDPEPGLESLRTVPGTLYDAVSGLNFEALWLNTQKAPLSSQAVRQALGYATDRTAIVSQVLGPIEPGIQPIDGTYTPVFGPVYSRTFSKYQRDLGMVDQLMKGDGWAKAADGVWTKAGSKAIVTVKTTSGDERRRQMAEMVQKQWQAAGFQVSVTYESPAALFGGDLPSGDFSAALYALTSPDSDPGQCVFWCSKNIPNQGGLYRGQNFTGTNDPNLDRAWHDADINFSPSARVADTQQAEPILADMVPIIPLAPLPDVLVVNTDKVGIEGGVFGHNLAFGPFADLNLWYQK